MSASRSSNRLGAVTQSGVITVLFTDLVDSTGLIERLGDDVAHAHFQRHFDALRQCIERYEGREVKALGDGLMVAFGSPLTALRCAAAMQRAVDGREGLRVGIDTGEPVQEDGDFHGAPVVLARRLCDSAGAGEVLVSAVTRALVGSRGGLSFEPRGPLGIKGLPEPIEALALDWRAAAEDALAPAAGTRSIRVLLADDEDLVRKGLRLILETEPTIEVVGEARSGSEALAQIEQLEPDVILMDIRMPGMDGLEACRALGEREARTKVIILTTFDHDENVYGALQAGASGFLLKSAPSDELMMAIRAVHRGDAILQPSVTRRLISEFARTPGPPRPPSGAFDELTAREAEIVQLVSRGLSNAEIAHDLVISETTVKSHVAAILMKLGLRDRIQVVVLAHETGFAGRALD